MRDAVEEKLRRYLSGPPESEAVVVHALTLIRKLMEHDQEKQAFGNLSLFCDWALHVKLDRAGAQQILRSLDEQVTKHDPFDPDLKVHEIISFGLLRKHLKAFCVKKGLPALWTEILVWQKFVVLYAEVVRDTPLIVTNEHHAFKHIRQLALTVCEPHEMSLEDISADKFFGFRWEFSMIGGETFIVNFHSNYVEP